MLPFREYFKWVGNPLIKLGKLYFLLIIITGIEKIVGVVLYIISGILLEEYLNTRNEIFIAQAVFYSAVVTGVFTVISIIITLLLGKYYYSGGEYSKLSLMRDIGILYIILTFFYGLGSLILIPTLFGLASAIGSRDIDKIIYIIHGPLVVSGFILAIAGFIGFIIFIALCIFLGRIGGNFKIEDAYVAIFLLIIDFLFGFVSGLVKTDSPAGAFAKAGLNIISMLIILALYYVFSKIFIKMGRLYENIEQNPEIIDKAIDELKKAEKTIDLIEFAHKNKIPYPVFMEKIKEKIKSGELPGSILNNKYYPSKASKPA